MTMTSEPLLRFTSHVEGRNATVEVYPDRIEWSRTSMVLRRKETNTIPIRQIQGVTTRRSSFLYTAVKVTTGGDAVEFHVSKSQAAEARELITKLVTK